MFGHFSEIPPEYSEYGKGKDEDIEAVFCDNDTVFASQILTTLIQPKCDPADIAQGIAKLDYGYGLSQAYFAIAYYTANFVESAQDYIGPFLRSLEDECIAVKPLYSHFPPFNTAMRDKGFVMAPPAIAIVNSMNVVILCVNTIMDTIGAKDLNDAALKVSMMVAAQEDNEFAATITPEEKAMTSSVIGELRILADASARMLVTHKSSKIFGMATKWVTTAMHDEDTGKEAGEEWASDWSSKAINLIVEAEQKHIVIDKLDTQSGFRRDAMYAATLRDFMAKYPKSETVYGGTGIAFAALLYAVSIGAMTPDVASPLFAAMNDKITEVVGESGE